MALLEDMFEGSLGTGLLIGVAALVLGPAVLPVVRRVAQPLINGVIESGSVLVREISAGVADAGEAARQAGAYAADTTEAVAGAAGAGSTRTTRTR